MVGYYRNPEETAKTIRGGWLRTGDMGRLDADNFLYIVERKKDLIIRGGFNIYPRDVEEALYAFPGVAEAAVIGLPDALMLAEPLAVVVRAVARGDAVAGESAVVLGVGALGLLAIQVLKARGLRVLAVGRVSRREDLARALGADGFATTEGGGATEAARAFSGREGVDLVVETAGTALAVEQGIELARPGGRVVLTGLPHEASTVNFFSVVRREIRIVGSMIYQQEFPLAIALLSEGKVRVGELVTHRFPLERLADAFVAHRSPDAIKVSVTT